MKNARWRMNNPLWKYFDKSNATNAKQHAICNCCGKELSFQTTITNLKHHLRRVHKDIYDEYLNNNKFMQSSNEDDSIYAIYLSKEDEEMHVESIDNDSQFSDDDSVPLKKPNIEDYVLKSPILNHAIQGSFPKKVKLEKRKDIDLAILKMIAYDFHPCSIVNDIGFREFLHALNPSYEIPEKKKLSSKLIPRIYENRLEQIKSNMDVDIKSVSVSMDCWTSVSKDNYMAITVHFISDMVEPKSILIQCGQFDDYHDDVEVYNEIKSILQEWDLYDKVNFFVTNNSTILNSTTKYLEWDGWTIFGCLAFKLNQIVQDTFDDIKDILAKAHRVVDHFRSNSKAKESLLNYQNTHQNSSEPKTLLKSNPTKWNSVYLMLQRFIELKQAIRVTILNLNTTLPNIDIKEWKIIEQVCILLKPLYEAINEMCADSYLLASKAFVITTSLASIYNNYTKLKDLYLPVEKIAIKLKDSLHNQLKTLELNIPICISTVLDPRFKLKPIKNQDNISNIKTYIINKMTDELNDQNQDLDHEDPATTSSNVDNKNETDIPSYSLWNEFDNEANIAPKLPKVIAAEELEKYLAEPLIKRTECAYAWWRERKYVYPTLFELFKRSCNIVLTSVPCEHIFSRFCDGVNDRRTCLSTSKVSQLMFLNANRFGYESE